MPLPILAITHQLPFTSRTKEPKHHPLTIKDIGIMGRPSGGLRPRGKSRIQTHRPGANRPGHEIEPSLENKDRGSSTPREYSQYFGFSRFAAEYGCRVRESMDWKRREMARGKGEGGGLWRERFHVRNR